MLTCGVSPAACCSQRVSRNNCTQGTPLLLASHRPQLLVISLSEIRRVSAETKIGIVMTTPPSKFEDGFRCYVGVERQTRWQYRRNQHRLIERLLAKFSRMESENIYLIPAYLNLDTERHFPMATEPRNAHCQELISRVCNGVHPSEAGQRQIGDSIYCWLQSTRSTIQ